jgi:hypothetical protein
LAAAGNERALICDTGAIIEYLVKLARAMAIDARFADLGLGLVDASVIALAEDLGVRRVATRDVRHFGVVRLMDGSALEIAG